MSENELIRKEKDRLRIFLILYTFSDVYTDAGSPELKRVFQSEQRVQKIDFLLRNPDYLSFELLNIAKSDVSKQSEIKSIVLNIFSKREPILYKLEMERFFYGAYEDIDDIIAFLKSVNFIEYSSKKNVGLRNFEKRYYITQFAIDKFEAVGVSMPFINWYIERCNLIKKYFGDLTGNELRILQYKIPAYRETSYKDYISDIEHTVKTDFYTLYSESL